MPQQRTHIPAGLPWAEPGQQGGTLPLGRGGGVVGGKCCPHGAVWWGLTCSPPRIWLSSPSQVHCRPLAWAALKCEGQSPDRAAVASLGCPQAPGQRRWALGRVWAAQLGCLLGVGGQAPLQGAIPTSSCLPSLSLCSVLPGSRPQRRHGMAATLPFVPTVTAS